MNKLNPEIEKALIAHRIPIEEGKLFLLSLYHEISLLAVHYTEPCYAHINEAGIYERDYETPGRIKWLIPLYEGVEPEIDKAWDWVLTEYRPLFGEIRNDAIGDKQGCLKKMKKFFADNPSVRKDDVIQATKMYLLEFRKTLTNNVKYLQKADYFISKVDAGTKQSRLEMYLEIIKNSANNVEPIAQRNLGQLLK